MYLIWPKPHHTFKFDISCGFTYKKYIYTLKRTIPSVRDIFTSPSLHRPYGMYWNINQLSIGFAIRLHLRTRLTLR